MYATCASFSATCTCSFLSPCRPGKRWHTAPSCRRRGDIHCRRQRPIQFYVSTDRGLLLQMGAHVGQGACRSGSMARPFKHIVSWDNAEPDTAVSACESIRRVVHRCQTVHPQLPGHVLQRHYGALEPRARAVPSLQVTPRRLRAGDIGVRHISGGPRTGRRIGLFNVRVPDGHSLTGAIWALVVKIADYATPANGRH